MINNDTLLKAVHARQQKQTEFGYGIMTADRYVATLRDDIGIEACYRFAATKRASFDDMLRKAASTLVYSNEEMKLEDVYGEKLKLPKDVELPKDTLMVFRHTLTTSKEDRDGDILRSDGAEVDPRMLLLWQHAHTLPIGKMLKVLKQTKSRLELISAIVDVNEMAHDAAVLVDNGMARFSHGFRALEFEEIKDGGFDIKEFEIMEESMVSVPANVDAEIGEVLLSLVEDGKLTSGVMKEHAATVKAGRNVSVPGVEIKYTDTAGDWKRELTCGSLADLKAAADAGLIGDKKDEDQSGDRTGESGKGCSCCGTPKEAAKDEDEGAEKDAGDKEVTRKKLTGAERQRVIENIGKMLRGELDYGDLEVVDGLVASLTSVGSHAQRSVKQDEIQEASDRDLAIAGAYAKFSKAKWTVEKAMAYVLTNADSKQRSTMLKSLQALEKVEDRSKRTKRFRALKAR